MTGRERSKGPGGGRSERLEVERCMRERDRNWDLNMDDADG